MLHKRKASVVTKQSIQSKRSIRSKQSIRTQESAPIIWGAPMADSDESTPEFPKVELPVVAPTLTPCSIIEQGWKRIDPYILLT